MDPQLLLDYQGLRGHVRPSEKGDRILVSAAAAVSDLAQSSSQPSPQLPHYCLRHHLSAAVRHPGTTVPSATRYMMAAWLLLLP